MSRPGQAPLTIHGFLDPATCRRIRLGMDAGAGEDAAVLLQETAGIDIRPAVRQARGIEVSGSVLAEVERRLDELRPTVAAFFGLDLAEREGSGFLRYGPGGFYHPHRDWTERSAWPGAARRQVAVVLFLNSARGAESGGDFDGGWLRLYSDESDEAPVSPMPATARPLSVASIDVVPREGMLVAFPARQWHEVTPVTAGTRDVVVDWYY
jgi:predicted 2-oxoglutarate/Fe(II)-dependent dioxygenase YbiX